MNSTTIIIIVLVVVIAALLLLFLTRNKSSSTDNNNNNNNGTTQKEYFADLANLLKGGLNVPEAQYKNFYNILLTQIAKDLCNKDLTNFTVDKFSGTGNDLEKYIEKIGITMKLIIDSNLPLSIKKDRIACLYLLIPFAIIFIERVNSDNTITLSNSLTDTSLRGKILSYSAFKDFIYNDPGLNEITKNIPSSNLTTTYACSNIFV